MYTDSKVVMQMHGRVQKRGGLKLFNNNGIEVGIASSF